jgi:hydrogenase maturation protein HypF
MAANMKSIRRFCTVSDKEEALLKSSESPIVILQINSQEELPQALAPGQSSLGFMLPYTPLHHLLLQQLDDPIVLTSGNLSDEPQCIDNDDAKKRLSNIADFMLLHNRDILNRVDDSVVRIIANEAVILRRSRGYAPVPLSLPPGFDSAPDALAMGGELKNTFCLIKDAQAIVSQHIGDLEDAPTYQDYLNNIQLYKQMYEHTAERIVIDKHPEYMSSKLGQKTSEKNNVPLDKVQHHHAHIAACMAENAWPLNAGPVLGIALDGLGHGGDTFWGGEFLLVNYADYQRVGSFRPVALLGGSKAMREPWRNTYAHLNIESDWSVLADKYEHLEIIQLLQSKPLATLNAMLQSGANSPLASSCGRLFDAVAAAVGFSAQTTSYEGQAAIEFEAVVDLDTLYHEDDSLSYSFEIVSNEMPFIDSTMMWPEVLEDLSLNTPRGVISARFHKGLAKIIVAMVDKVTSEKKSHDINTIALSGGVFQNRILNEQVITRLREKGYQVLTHHQIPANDGGISFGQAVVSAARAIATFKET